MASGSPHLDGSAMTASTALFHDETFRDSTTLPPLNTYSLVAPSSSTPSTPVSSSTASHSRSASSDTTASTGSAYHFILEHLLSYPGTYGTFDSNPAGSSFRSGSLNSRSNELPLRSMYTLNSAAPPLSGTTTPPSASGSPTAHSFSAAQNSPTLGGGNSNRFQQEPVASRNNPAALFMSSIMDQIAQIPQQPASLPPAFVTSFLNRCFPIVLEAVDFPQSLTALDYLKDLEMRRRKEIAYTLNHHGFDQSVLESSDSLQQLAEMYPQLSHYLGNLETKEKRADALYTQLYVALRRWILINEMALTPFNKHNCHAMLNTLYPPVEMSQPTAKLTIPLLKAQREGFFNYIRTVERQGPMCLQTLMQQGAKPGDPNGWPAVKRTLNNYLRLSNSMILESQDITTLDPVVNTCWNITPEISTIHTAGLNMDSSLGLEPVLESAQEQEEELAKEPTPPNPAEQKASVDLGKEIGKSSPQVTATSFAPYQKHKPKNDSGFSFGIDGKHSKQPSTSSSRSSTSGNRVVSGQFTGPNTSMFDFGRGSTLERLTRELKKMRRKPAVEEIIKPDRSSVVEKSQHSAPATTTKFQLRDRTSSISGLRTSASMGFSRGKENRSPLTSKSEVDLKMAPQPKSKPPSPTRTRFPSLRKMKSFGDFKSATNNAMYSKVDKPRFDMEEMRRQREEYERRNFI